MTNDNGLRIDLRKSDPLGLDFSAAYDRAHTAAALYARLGPENAAARGWFEHRTQRAAYRHTVADFVTLAKLLAAAIGLERANKIEGLRWALGFENIDAGLDRLAKTLA